MIFQRLRDVSEWVKSQNKCLDEINSLREKRTGFYPPSMSGVNLWWQHSPSFGCCFLAHNQIVRTGSSRQPVHPWHIHTSVWCISAAPSLQLCMKGTSSTTWTHPAKQVSLSLLWSSVPVTKPLRLFCCIFIFRSRCGPPCHQCLRHNRRWEKTLSLTHTHERRRATQQKQKQPVEPWKLF